MLVELATGAPLFPGESDIDQLWLIIKVRLLNFEEWKAALYVIRLFENKP